MEEMLGLLGVCCVCFWWGYARFLALTIEMTSRSFRMASSPILLLSRASMA